MVRNIVIIFWYSFSVGIIVCLFITRFRINIGFNAVLAQIQGFGDQNLKKVFS
jgi:hypothetical protein